MYRLKANNSTTGNVVSYGWTDEVLEIEFAGRKGKPNSVYQYSYVPEEKWQRLRRADSAGEYLHKEIIPVYRARKLS